MYTETDLQSAVAAGAITAEAAEALRIHAGGQSSGSRVDEEHFRLVTGFGDIFVSIAAVLFLGAMAGLGYSTATGLSALLVAGTAWGLAEFFTLKRRMALPSIVLTLAFLGGVAVFPIATLDRWDPQISNTLKSLIAPGTGLLVALAAWIHWRRFMIPITIAGGATAIVVTLIGLINFIGLMRNPNFNLQPFLLPLIFMSGLTVFAYAMWWDISDPARETRRSDIAFWLHLLAAPMIAHPLFKWLGISDSANAGTMAALGAALGVVGLYSLLGVVAVAVDRRALLVSALVYVLAAMATLLNRFGLVELNVAVTGLLIGSALLTLSAFWTPIRAALIRFMPAALQHRLPHGAARSA